MPVGDCTNPAAIYADEPWAFTAPADGTYTFELRTHLSSLTISVQETCERSAVSLACNANGVADGANPVHATLGAGETVYVVVDGWPDADGDGSYTLEVTAAP